MKTSKIELLAPAGSYPSLQSAIKAGSDAVYFGVTHLNMRYGCAKEFDLSDIKKIVSICHKSGIRAYLVVNVIVYDAEMKLMRKIVDAAKKNKVDAIIASDVSVLQYCQGIGQEVHASTQLSLSNFEAVKFYARFCDRVVLARELNLRQIKNISHQIQKHHITGPKGKLMEIEGFGHGAMCISVSGRCFMSTFEHGLSANRGLCRQLCRRPYKIIDQETGSSLRVESQYVMSPEDMCSIDFLDALLDAGIQSLKIEGRGRSPEYVYIVVSAYRKALNALEKGEYTDTLIKELFADLKSVYNRGLSKGFFYGKPINAWSRSYGSKATTRKLFVGKVTHFFPKPSIAEIRVQSGDMKCSDTIYIIGQTTGTVKTTITELRDEQRVSIQSASKGDLITFQVPEKVRVNDDVYIIEKVSTEKRENDKNPRLRDRIQDQQTK
jgi:putative protease